MKSVHLLLAIIIVPVLLLSGCTAVTYKYASSPEVSRLETAAFRVGFAPEKGDAKFYSWFKLDVENNSDTVIEIDWNQTRYLLDGKSLGGFVWAGIDPGSIKTNTVPNDMIQPGQAFSKKISPMAKVAMAQRKDYAAGKDKPGLYSGILPAGENSIVLAVKAEGHLIRKKLTVTITEHTE